ncbi:hypothetical protein [Delftia sp. K82]|uniref:hypothetical protein n=1 Tax=Delftia sp. K82 TaxID=1472718 RepID=UPI000B48A435|nr:hypothetical protein [Delftia sp. K82]
MPHIGRNRFPGPCRFRQGRRLLARCLLATLAGLALPLLAAPESGRASDFSRPAQSLTPSPAALRIHLKSRQASTGHGKPAALQRFCFVQQHNRSAVPARLSVWMVWLEGGQIANLGQRRFTAKPSPDEAQWDGDALSEAKAIHLATDVRETAQETTGSSILVERTWVDRLLAQCQAKGRKVEVRPLR